MGAKPAHRSGSQGLPHSALKASRLSVEGLSPYNTVGKLKNLKITQADIDTQKPNLASLDLIKSIQRLMGDLGPLAAYLAQAEMALPENHEWVINARESRVKVVSELVANRAFGQGT